VTEYRVQMVSVEASTIGLPFAQSVIRITRKVTETKPGSEPTTGSRLYVSSMSCPPMGHKKALRVAKAFAGVSRSHWSVENKNHWKKDALWGDDTPRQKSPQVARMLTLLRGALLSQIREPMTQLFKKCSRSASLACGIVKSALKPLK
jgi:hypothetical protein